MLAVCVLFVTSTQVHVDTEIRMAEATVFLSLIVILVECEIHEARAYISSNI